MLVYYISFFINAWSHSAFSDLVSVPNVCITEKPGTCPKKLGVAVSGVCADRCSHDGDCPNDEKCCSNRCGHKCMSPYEGVYIITACGSALFFLFSETFSD